MFYILIILNNIYFINKGSKYYGGWWQCIGEKQREKILMEI